MIEEVEDSNADVAMVNAITALIRLVVFNPALGEPVAGAEAVLLDTDIAAPLIAVRPSIFYPYEKYYTILHSSTYVEAALAAAFLVWKTWYAAAPRAQIKAASPCKSAKVNGTCVLSLDCQ